MKKINSLGFTLIELLSVIIILAIIALIAVPTILNIIDSSKKKALENSAYGLTRAGELYYANGLLNDNNSSKIFEGPDYAGLNFKGEKVANGSVIVSSDGKVSIWLYKDGHCTYKKESSNQVSSKEVESANECKKMISICSTVGNSEISYDYGTAYTCDPGDGEFRTFYVLDSSEDSVSLIMDRNLVGNVAWASKDDYIASGGSEEEYGKNGNNNKGPISAMKYLKSKTENWKDVSDVNLPTGRQIATAGKITEWTDSNFTSKIMPKWLRDYTCYDNCIEQTIKSYGYWTSTLRAGSSSLVWRVHGYGILDTSDVNDDSAYGIRPVITIPKSLLN